MLHPMLHTIVSLASAFKNSHKYQVHQATLTRGKTIFFPITFYALLKNYFHSVLNKNLKPPIATRWQIIGIHNTGLSCREIGRQLNPTVINRLVRKYEQTNGVKDRNRPG